MEILNHQTEEIAEKIPEGKTGTAAARGAESTVSVSRMTEASHDADGSGKKPEQDESYFLDEEDEDEEDIIDVDVPAGIESEYSDN